MSNSEKITDEVYRLLDTPNNILIRRGPSTFTLERRHGRQPVIMVICISKDGLVGRVVVPNICVLSCWDLLTAMNVVMSEVNFLRILLDPETNSFSVQFEFHTDPMPRDFITDMIERLPFFLFETLGPVIETIEKEPKEGVAELLESLSAEEKEKLKKELAVDQIKKDLEHTFRTL